jgi:selenocysteine-specific elongation factor
MPFVVGTAGHIDHGKTALVRALTGQDTDRLPEERARGISIDLGFAHLDGPDGLRAGVVDVPGHERFIRNMLAGAHAMDLVLLVVAADDGVMPQTAEHLDILHLLGVERGIVVVTKTDLVDAARIAAVREEIEILLLGTSLEGSPIFPVSSTTGAGLAALRAELERRLAAAAPADRGGRFRLPVDRAFSMRGHGLVVTGTAVAGTVASGDVVRVLPGGETVRVRSLETHGASVERAGQRQRLALNLAGVERADVARGHVVCDPRIERTSQRFDAWLEVRPGARRGLRHHGRVRLHVGTAEMPAKVVLLDRRPCLDAGGSTWAQVVPTAPVVVMRGDRFVLRDETARATIGGGVVVHPFADRHRPDPRLAARLEALFRGDDAVAATAFLDLAPEFAVTSAALASGLDVDDARLAAALGGAADVVLLSDAGHPEACTTSAKWDRFVATALERVRAAHAADPLAPGLEMESLRTALPWDVPPRVFRRAVERVLATGALARDESVLRLPGHSVALDQGRRALAERLTQALRDGGLTPPDVRQLETLVAADRRAILDVLGVLEQQRRVVRVAPDLFYDPAAVAEGTQRLAAYCAQHGEITAAAFRDLIGASRKFAIALLDWCDRTGVTLRIGDARRLRRAPVRA